MIDVTRSTTERYRPKESVGRSRFSIPVIELVDGSPSATQRQAWGALELDRINLNLLVPLAVLLETRNVTRAGKRLHLTQSATSAILARLRSALGDELLVKSGREMVLTPYAEGLVQPLAHILGDIDTMMRRRPSFDPLEDRKAFTLIASDYSTLFIIRPLLEQLASEAPHVSVDVQPLQDDYADRINADEADLLIVSEQLCSQYLPDFPRRALFHDRFVLAAWDGNKAIEPPIRIDELRLLRFVQYVHGQRLNLADKALDDLGVVRQVEVRTASQLLVPFLLTGTPLVALIPDRLAQAAKAVAELQIIELPVSMPAINDACTWHPRRSGDPAHHWLVERLTELAVSL
jgi:DNA-binding transcriptional LysR family regulator